MKSKLTLSLTFLATSILILTLFKVDYRDLFQKSTSRNVKAETKLLASTENLNTDSQQFSAFEFLADEEVYIDQEEEGLYETCSATLWDHDFDEGQFYSLEGSKIVTFCPDDDSAIQVEFIEFALRSGYSLNIYDGTDTDADLIGTYAAQDNPGTLMPSADNTSGCLTFEYIGDGENVPANNFGFEAEINCAEPCQQITADIESITFEFGDEVFDAEFENGAYALPKNKEVTFVGSADFENDGSGASYHWDFGDGNQANGETATNTYEETGEYEVTLTVTDEQGCTTAYVFQVDVQEDFISVDTDEYTVEELITDVLIDNECAEISNITYSDASTNGQGFSSIGYFDAGFSDFPIN